MLTLDFYESGQGESIVIRFPDGGLGLVDAHPTPSGSRSGIVDIVRGQHLHFLCLSHPHADHGADLYKAMQAAARVDRFWHTVSDTHSFIYSISQQYVFPDRYLALATELRVDATKYLIDLYSEVRNRSDKDPGFVEKINFNKRSHEIAGVKVHFFGPMEADQHKFTNAHIDLAKGKNRGRPNENILSAVIVLEYGPNAIILGADALASNWEAIEPRYRKEALPKAAILKIPHHGATNSLGHHRKNYLDLLKPNKETKAVLFAGDAKHPNKTVFDKVRNKASVVCLANGLMPPARAASNPLGLTVAGARSATPTVVCNPHIRFEISAAGVVTQSIGRQCGFCDC